MCKWASENLHCALQYARGTAADGGVEAICRYTQWHRQIHRLVVSTNSGFGRVNGSGFSNREESNLRRMQDVSSPRETFKQFVPIPSTYLEAYGAFWLRSIATRIVSSFLFKARQNLKMDSM